MSSSPSAHPTVSPYLVVDDVAALIAFTERCFDAEEVDRQTGPGGTVIAASVRIGNSVVMMAEEKEVALGPALVHVYVDDVDATYRRALDAGATSLAAPAEASEGRRRAGVQDASGTQWWISTAPNGSEAV